MDGWGLTLVVDRLAEMLLVGNMIRIIDYAFLLILRGFFRCHVDCSGA